MKKFLFSALLALSSLTTSQAANLYSSNLGNGIATVGAANGIASGTVRFGVFPPGFDFDANAANYAALDAAFTQVYSFSGALTVDAVNGFYQTAPTYATDVSYETVPYSTIAGQKVYVWILNRVDAALATQQAIFSTDATWVSPTAVVQDTIVSIDTGAPGLTVHLGQLANGNNIGAGALAHTTEGALVEVSGVAITRTPAEGQILEGSTVSFSATVSEGTFPLFYQWRKDGVAITGAESATFTIDSAMIGDFGVYDVLVSNTVSTDIPSNAINLSVVTPTPTIINDPQSTVVAVGSVLNLGVDAVGAGTLTYQWKKGADLPGQTEALLRLPNVTLAQAGTYSVVVSNASGKATSANAEVVVVNQAPEIVVSPVGGTVALKAIVAGKNATYQWFRGETRIYNSTKFLGATTPTLTIRAVNLLDSNNYSCRVTTGSSSAFSGVRTVKVFDTAPLIDAAGLPMPNGRIGASYSFQIPTVSAANRGATLYAATNLPTGLKLDTKTGLITGRPTKTGTFNVVLRASNARGTAESAVQPVVINGILPGLEGSYIGVVERQAVLGGELGGRFEMLISNTGAVSGKLLLGVETYPLVGFIEASAFPVQASFMLQRKGGLSPLNISFELEGDDYLVNGLITDTENDLNFNGFRNIWTTAAPATAYRGLYNAAIDLENEDDIGAAAIPQGAGYLTFSIANDGKLSIKGKTADGIGLTTATFVGPAGEVFLFNTLYTTARKGSILSLFEIAVGATNADNTLLGAATWSRPVDPAAAQKTYKAGFGPVDVIVFGGRYTPPVSPLVALDLALNSVVDLNFEEGGISGVNPNVDIRLEAKSKAVVTGANPGSTTLTIAEATGLITGGFKLGGLRTAKFEGVILPENGELVGLGHFLLPNAANSQILSGLVSLEEPAAVAP